MKGSATFQYDNKTDEYVVHLKKKNFWWLLIFLLPFLLLILQIRISKTVVFRTVESETRTPLSDMNVVFQYIDKNFISFSPFEFFGKDTVFEQGITDSDGLIKFKISLTLYQKIFHSRDKSFVYAYGGCFASDSLYPLLKDLKENPPLDILMFGRKTKADFLVLDAEDKQPIPQANVRLTYQLDGKTYSLEKNSVANGSVLFEKIIFCADKILAIASKYGYTSDTIEGKIDFILSSVENRKFYLKPIRKRIEFIVKDLETKEVIPGAKAELISDKNTYFITTNTNGLGRGAFDSVAVFENFKIHVSHPAYYDTVTRIFNAQDYINLDEEHRTIYLRPKANNLTFRNVDKFTGEPLEGVRNAVYVNGDSIGVFYSNSDGFFTVPGLKKEDKITINSTKPGYYPHYFKNQRVENLKTQEDRKLPLEPIPPEPYDVKPPKKNCRAHFSGTLLSDKIVNGHISKIFQPDKYGEYVGEGYYPSNKAAFPNAVKYTFDAIAVDAHTRVIIYSEENFKGKVLLDVVGPALINNVKWKGDERLGDFIHKKFFGDLESWFPQSSRRWSNSNMNDWSHGSVKVICQ